MNVIRLPQRTPRMDRLDMLRATSNLPESVPGDFGLTLAREIAESSESECIAIFERLRASRKLSVAVRQINLLLESNEHRKLAQRALRRLGFHLPDLHE